MSPTITITGKMFIAVALAFALALVIFIIPTSIRCLSVSGRAGGGAQVLIEGNYFVGASKPIFGTDGYAVARDIDFTDSTNHNTAPLGNPTAVPYQYSLLVSANVVGAVVGEAGATLAF
ncbi:hypothetical protein TWF106_009497 [Orbilia oligospora]|uniref:Pectate lyase n=1 Tax=Orbilia oligospora TaxID=2813651 RepID=A0A7C8UQ00_ORBOL|nr:hypothetical protein TWF106_009497 [Orbilia oligospora]